MRILVLLAGCVTADALESASVRHERQAERLAAEGKGAAAQHKSERAAAEHEAARRSYEKRGSYWQSEVLLR
jgi:hypothetical protein